MFDLHPYITQLYRKFQFAGKYYVRAATFCSMAVRMISWRTAGRASVGETTSGTQTLMCARAVERR